MTCSNCQAKNGPDDNFCLQCGMPLRADEPAASPAAPPGGTAEAPVRAEYTYGTFGGNAVGKDPPGLVPSEGRGGDDPLTVPYTVLSEGREGNDLLVAP